MNTGRTSATTAESYLTGLRHPGWWAAVVVLIFNDHVLKQVHALPGWLTGKISDFAGLIVAPVLLVAIARVSGRSVRVACFAAVSGLFVAIKLWPDAARATEAAVALAGIKWRIWSDWTDLVALSVLPLAWTISVTGSTARPGVSRLRKLSVIDLGGAALGGLACIATSDASLDRIETSVYLVNITHASIPLEVHRVTAQLDCGAVVNAPEETLRAATFAFERCWEAAPFQTVPLDIDWRSVDDPKDADPPRLAVPRPCDAIVLRAPGLPDTVVFWNDVPKISIDRDATADDDDRAIYIESVGARLFVQRGAFATVWPAPPTLPAPTCSRP